MISQCITIVVLPLALWSHYSAAPLFVHRPNTDLKRRNRIGICTLRWFHGLHTPSCGLIAIRSYPESPLSLMVDDLHDPTRQTFRQRMNAQYPSTLLHEQEGSYSCTLRPHVPSCLRPGCFLSSSVSIPQHDFSCSQLGSVHDRNGSLVHVRHCSARVLPCCLTERALR
jgi:hypothetical protein